MKTLTGAALAVLFALPAFSAEGPEMEKVLVPLIVQQPTPGAYGSVFTTRLSVLNEANRPVLITGYDPQCPALCAPADPSPTPAGVTFVDPPLANWIDVSEGLQGYFMGVEKELSNRVRFNLRVHDLSRQSKTWGTEIPVVRESQALNGTASLLDIPLTDGFRQTLRLYDFDSSNDAAAVVRFYAVDPSQRPQDEPLQADRLLLEIPVQFRTATSGQGRLAHPGYAEIFFFGARPELLGIDLVRVEITPIGDLRYWAFVSITNNETQHITVVSPR